MTSAAEIPWLEPLLALSAAVLAFLSGRALRLASSVWLGFWASLWIAGLRSPWLLIPAVGSPSSSPPGKGPVGNPPQREFSRCLAVSPEPGSR